MNSYRHVTKEMLSNPKVVAAIQALEALLANGETTEQGYDMVNRVYADVVRKTVRQIFTTRRTLDADKLNGDGSPILEWIGPGCQNPPPSTDHGELLGRAGKPEIFVSHPYGPLKLEPVKEIVAYADKYKLDLDISADSHYFPHRSLQVVFKKK